MSHGIPVTRWLVSRPWLGLLLALAAGCTQSQQEELPSGPCYVQIAGTLSYLGDGGVVSVTDSQVPDGGVVLSPGQLVNLTYYFQSSFDFQYQVKVVEQAHGLVVETLVPTTALDVWPEDNSAYAWDVIPVDTTGMRGTYSVQLGAHLDVDLSQYNCTEPLDSQGRLVVSNWKTMELRMATPGTGSSSSGGASSSSHAAASSSSSGS